MPLQKFIKTFENKIFLGEFKNQQELIFVIHSYIKGKSIAGISSKDLEHVLIEKFNEWQSRQSEQTIAVKGHLNVLKAATVSLSKVTNGSEFEASLMYLGIAKRQLRSQFGSDLEYVQYMDEHW